MKKFVAHRWLFLLSFVWAASSAYANNPCISDAYTADPTPLWVNNTMYLYCSHDANFVTGQTGYNIPNDVLISSTDLVNWEDDGVITTTGVTNPWAPAVIYVNGTYYLYYTAGGGAVGVLTSTSPYGPFAGGNTNLVTGATSDPGMGGNLLDPAPFIDTNGQAYLYFGGGGPGTGAGNCSRVIKLNANMISVNGSGSGVPAPNFFEASGINVRNGVYYYSYSSDPAYGMNIEYIMANNALFTGPTIPAQPIAVANGGAANCYNNQGGGFVNIGTNWYASYFNRALANANGLACSEGDYQRSVCFDQMTFNSDGTISEIAQTTTGPTALQDVNPFVTQAAACMASEGGVAPSGLSEKGPQSEACSEGGRDLTDIEATDWVEVRNLNFGSCASTFTGRVAATAAGGVIQLRLGSTTGTLIGTCTVSATGGTQTWENVSCAVTGATGVQNLYFVFSGTAFNFESYSFTTCGSPTPSPSTTATPSRTHSPTATNSPTWTYSPTQTRTATPTASLTATRTPSGTPTDTPSLTASATATATASSTATASRTASASPTGSPTLSVTSTDTASVSPTISPTPEGSSTASPTATLSLTASPTVTASLTASPTDTVSSSDTPSSSDTASPSDTPSLTATTSFSPGASPTDTATATPSVTRTATPTLTQSASAVWTGSVTRTGTPTVTATASPTAAPSSTATPQVPELLSLTATSEVTGSASDVTVTGSGFVSGDLVVVSVGGVSQAPIVPSSVSAGQLVFTLPAQLAGTTGVEIQVQSPQGLDSNELPLELKAPATEVAGGPLQIQGFYPVPNPNPGRFAVLLKGPADEVDFRVYSVAMVLVGSLDSGSMEAGWGSVDAESILSRLPDGLYYVVAIPIRGAVRGSSAQTKAYILH